MGFLPQEFAKFLFIIIEKSLQIVNDEKYPLTFPCFVDVPIDPPPQAKNPV